MNQLKQLILAYQGLLILLWLSFISKLLRCRKDKKWAQVHPKSFSDSHQKLIAETPLNQIHEHRLKTSHFTVENTNHEHEKSPWVQKHELKKAKIKSERIPKLEENYPQEKPIICSSKLIKLHQDNEDEENEYAENYMINFQDFHKKEKKKHFEDMEENSFNKSHENLEKPSTPQQHELILKQKSSQNQPQLHQPQSKLDHQLHVFKGSLTYTPKKNIRKQETVTPTKNSILELTSTRKKSNEKKQMEEQTQSSHQDNSTLDIQVYQFLFRIIRLQICFSLSLVISMYEDNVYFLNLTVGILMITAVDLFLILTTILAFRKEALLKNNGFHIVILLLCPLNIYLSIVSEFNEEFYFKIYSCGLMIDLSMSNTLEIWY